MKVLGVGDMKFKAKRFEEALADTTDLGQLELLVEEGEAYRVVKLAYDRGPKYPSLVKIEGQDDLFASICSPKTRVPDPPGSDATDSKATKK